MAQASSHLFPVRLWVLQSLELQDVLVPPDCPSHQALLVARNQGYLEDPFLLECRSNQGPHLDPGLL